MIKTSILILGETGNGKSSLGNFILNRENAFSISDNTNSETKETSGKYGQGNTKNIFVIDTPGLQDPEGKDKIQFEKLLIYTKKQTHLNSIVIVLNYNYDRFAQHIKNMIRLLCNAFPQENFFEHVALVWTKYYYYLSDKLKKKRFTKIESVKNQMINLIEEENHKCPKSFPCFFVDTDFKRQDLFSKMEINRLIAWSSTLSSLDTNLTRIVDPLVSKEIYEYREIYSHKNKYLNKITTFYSQQKRKKQILYNNVINYSNWIEYNQRSSVYYEPRKYIGSDFESKIEQVRRSYYYYTYEGGFWRKLFDNLERVEHVHYYYEPVIYKREIKKYNDGTQSIGEWYIQ